MLSIANKKNKGFSLLEVLVSIAIFSLILLTVVGSLVAMSNSNSKNKASREARDNAKKALEQIAYEIRSAKSVYAPTTTSSQLSLETLNYLPAGETATYIDFFLCGTAICLKKEGQSPYQITGDNVEVTALAFIRVQTGSTASVKVDLTVNYLNSGGNPSAGGSSALTTSASLRSY